MKAEGGADGAPPNILDLFGMSGPAAGSAGGAATAAPGSNPAGGAGSSDANKTSDDLLQLTGNPFASVLNANATSSNPGPAAGSIGQPQPFGTASPFAPSSASGANGT